MGYLVLNKAAGGTKILAGTNPYIQVTKADQKQELLGIETFNITIESKTPILFSVGDSIDVFGRRYWINDPQNVTIADTGDKFIYDIQMEGIQYRFINAVLFAMGISEYAPSTEVIYTANLLEALRLVITCVNFNEGWEMFVLDEATVPETKRMTLSFSDTNCLAALQTICGKDFFNVLFKFTEQQDGTYKLRVGTTVGENLPYSFVVGQKGGAYDIKRNKGGNSGVSFTRLFAYGSSENISNSYRGYSSRLRLPGAVPAGYTLPAGIELVNDTQRNLNYVQLVGATHKVSTTKTYADIKPHRTGVVSGIDGSNVNRFFDASMDFDINEKLPNGDTKYLLNGQAAKVHFNTGKLAGLEFDATYNHSQKSFTLVSYADERGQTFPDPKTTTFRVSEGDEYVILNINMPDLYIEKAEKELLVAAVKDLQDSFSPANKYTVKIRELYLKKYESPGVQNNFFNVGDFVNVKNTAMNLDSNIQILSFTRSWLNPLNYTLELSDVVTISYMVQMLGAIEAINNVVSINKLDNPARTKRNWRVSEEIASKIETLRTDMVLVGKPEGQYDTNIKFEYNYGGNRNRIISTSGALIHSVYNEGVQAGTWNVGASDNTLTDSDGMKFVYIKAEVNSASAFIVFSDNEIGVDSVVGYYHFPYCILSSVLAGSRTATKFKGRTQVIGDEISTGHIKGNGLDIDLNSGTVTGKVKIVTANGSIKTVEQAIDEVEVGGRNLILNTKSSNTQVTFPNGVSYHFFFGLTPISNFGLKAGDSVVLAFNLDGVPAGYYCGASFAVEVNGSVIYVQGAVTYQSGQRAVCVYKLPDGTTQIAPYIALNIVAAGSISFNYNSLKLEKGNKMTDWSPAPEDVQSAINTAQNTANTANQSVSSLNTYVDGAFKDGVIDSAEAKAIEKYINTVNTEYDKAISSYNVVANNSYLDGTPKTTLINAKVTLAGAKDSLMSAINTAIADGKTTISEKAAVDAAYTSYKSAFGSYSAALENANKAIQQKLDNISTDKVNAIEVGGRNLIFNSKTLYGWSISNPDKLSNGEYEMPCDGADRYVSPGLEGSNGVMEIGETYTISCKAKCVNPTENARLGLLSTGNGSVYLIGNLATEYKIYSFSFTCSDVSGYIAFGNYVSNSAGSVIFIKEFKVEKGNKATDWSPAPEDVQSAINTAQNAANTANQSVSSLNTYVDGAFKDGIIDSAEAKAIEKYINTVNTEYDKAINSYNVVANNSYLVGTPKTTLINAKVTLAGAKDSLMSAISTAIADGKTTVSEKAAVDAAYASYKSAFGSYSTALENANKAIQQKLDSLSTDKVNAIEVGGRNYFLDSEIERVFSAREIGKINGFSGGETITLSFEAKYVGVDVLSIQVLNGGTVYGGTQLLRINVTNPNYTKYSQTITLPASLDNLRLVGWLGSNGTGTGYAKKFKVEKGNKATDWSPAPEDVQAKIDNIKPAGKNYLIGSRTDSLVGWGAYGGTMSVVTDAQYGKVVEYSRPAGGGDFMKSFTIDTSELKNTELVFYCIAKPISGTTIFNFGGWQETFGMLNNNSPYRDLGNGWRLYYKTFTAGSAIASGVTFGLNSVGGTWRFHSFGVAKGNTPPSDWDASPKEIDFLKQGYQASTDIEGGVVQTAVLLLRNALEQVTAGISGLSGDNVINWGAGTYQDAINDAVKSFGDAMITSFLNKDDGGGHLAFGKIAWDNAGQLLVRGAIEALSGQFGLLKILGTSIIGDHLKITDEAIESKATATGMRNYTIPSKTELRYMYKNAPTQQMDSNVVTIESPTTISYVRGTYGYGEMYLYSDDPADDIVLSTDCTCIVRITIQCLNNGNVIASANSAYSIVGVQNGSYKYPDNLWGASLSNIAVSAGTVMFRMIATISDFFPSAAWIDRPAIRLPMNMRITADSSSARAATNLTVSAYVKRTMLGGDGLYNFANANRYVYWRGAGDANDIFEVRLNNSILKMTETYFDIPGGLGGGTISSGGGISNRWGLAGTIASRSTNTTTIKHNVTDTKFTVDLTPRSSFTWYVSSITAASSPTANDGNIVIVCSSTTAVFDFTIKRTPY